MSNRLWLLLSVVMLLGVGVMCQPVLAINWANHDTAQYTGALSNLSGGQGLTGGGSWAGTFNWWVWQEGTNWVYEYELDAGAQNISHALVETSPDIGSSEIWWNNGGTWTSAGPGTVATWLGPSNPGLPASLTGLKFETTGDTTWHWAVVTPQIPVWGDFYAKDGRQPGTENFNYVYNNDHWFNDGTSSTDAAAWVDDPPPPVASYSGVNDATYHFNILRPDTETFEPPTPELSTTLLLLTAMLPVGVVCWKRRRS